MVSAPRARSRVKVIVAHCAGLGSNEDLDDTEKKRVHNLDLFMRLMEEKRYEGLVFGEISAMTQYHRIEKPLTTILAREDLHERLVNGSDYPLPAINMLIRTSALVRHGYLDAEERVCLNEIYDYNPLLFDFGNRLAPTFSVYEEESERGMIDDNGRKLRRIVYRWNGRFYTRAR